MWNIKDGNKQIGFLIKTENFKKHLLKINSIKSQLNLHKCRPWRPSFSLSKKKTKFTKDQQNEVDFNNDHLMKNLANIDENPIQKTMLQVPQYIPSHKQNYFKFKQRERNKKLREVSKQNLKVFARIFTASTSYDRNKFEKCWIQTRLQLKKMSRIQKKLNYREQATKSLNNSRISKNFYNKNKVYSTIAKGFGTLDHQCLSMHESVQSKFKKIR